MGGAILKILGGLCLVLIGVSGLPRVASGHTSEKPEKGVRVIVGPRPWNARLLTPRRLKLEMTAGTCTGREPPKVVETRIVKRPQAVIITAIVRREKANACMGEMRFVRTHVELEKPLGNRVLYDGSTSPPTRRVPEE